MKVILQVDVKGTGKKGELHEVSEGYGRNYLLPRKLAVVADSAALNDLKNRESAVAHHKAEELANAKAKADELNNKRIKLSAKAGANGKLFGSITSKEIAHAIAEQLKIEVDKRQITAPDIKSTGEFTASIKIMPNISADIIVCVVLEN